jgi:hypothetical protein
MTEDAAALLRGEYARMAAELERERHEAKRLVIDRNRCALALMRVLLIANSHLDLPPCQEIIDTVAEVLGT